MSKSSYFFLFFVFFLFFNSANAVTIYPTTTLQASSNNATITINNYAYDIDLVQIDTNYVYLENVSCTEGTGVIIASSINVSTSTTYALDEQNPCRTCTATGNVLLNLYPLMVVIAGLLFITTYTVTMGSPDNMNAWIVLIVGIIMIAGVLLQIVQSFQGVACT